MGVLFFFCLWKEVWVKVELFCQCKGLKRYIAAAKLKKQQQQQDKDFPVEEDEVKAAAGPTYSMEVIVLGGQEDG